MRATFLAMALSAMLLSAAHGEVAKFQPEIASRIQAEGGAPKPGNLDMSDIIAK